uniref:Uncharacterized protein n=1 Tax=Strombidium rassoulzadegani TaxID=1082188 RepID=A0A7S3FUJ5_9SPIT|mmetsp:Transcript_2049/g.3624  ORF Transcript_2049/g.3624 Transcript_2049/m.3624 type:complete len:319 (+) Transcript_2049:424-1380(+)
MFDGKGRMTHPNGDIYQGQWREGKACGKGIFLDQQGSMYEGEWLNDLYHGKGVENWNYNKIVYTGDFVEGQKTGKGKFEFDGNVYEGDFVEGKFSGKGKYIFAKTGQVYVGDFEDNNMHGKGKMIWTNGTSYEGDFKQGKMEGVGQRSYENGDKYDGEWLEDMRHGQGVYFNAAEKKELSGKFEYDQFVPEEPEEPVTSPWGNMRKVVVNTENQKFRTDVRRSTFKKADPNMSNARSQALYSNARGHGLHSNDFESHEIRPAQMFNQQEALPNANISLQGHEMTGRKSQRSNKSRKNSNYHSNLNNGHGIDTLSSHNQ